MRDETHVQNRSRRRHSGWLDWSLGLSDVCAAFDACAFCGQQTLGRAALRRSPMPINIRMIKWLTHLAV